MGLKVQHCGSRELLISPALPLPLVKLRAALPSPELPALLGHARPNTWYQLKQRKQQTTVRYSVYAFLGAHVAPKSRGFDTREGWNGLYLNTPTDVRVPAYAHRSIEELGSNQNTCSISRCIPHAEELPRTLELPQPRAFLVGNMLHFTRKAAQNNRAQKNCFLFVCLELLEVYSQFWCGLLACWFVCCSL